MGSESLAISSDVSSLRAGFQAETKDKAIRDTRLTAIVGSVLYLLFCILDYFAYPHLFLVFLLIRIVVVLGNMLILLLMWTKTGMKHPLLFAVLEYLLHGSGIILMVHFSGGHISAYYAGVNLVLMAFISILPLDARRTAFICSILYAMYIVSILSFQRVDHFDIFLNNNFFLLATIVLVVLSSHLATQMRFREFSARFNLARANEELKKLDVLKSQFFANVSHEVRTPLTSILSPIQSLYQGDLGPMDPEHQRLVGQVYRNALKLLDMINQMLDFSKFEARRMQLRLKYVDIDELARDIVTTFQDVTARKGLKLSYVTEGELRPAYLDPEKLERILTNLIRNAIKFTESGSITVRAGGSAANRWIEVRDTGIGIPSQHLANIFNRFQQVDSSSTRRYEGTGLGLTIVKESVELMQGSISVQSEERRGTMFRVELPGNLDQLAPDAFIDRRTDPERRQPEEEFDGDDRRKNPRRESDLARITADDLALIEKHQISRGASEGDVAEKPANGCADRILLVEDNVDLRAYISKMLFRFGHEVATAIDGLDGWEHVQTDLPDLVVSDIMMPRMDGYELVGRIKSTDKTRSIPVILITAKPELEAKLEGLQKGADDYLPKPINIRELDARIKNLLVTRNLQRALAREAELGAKMEELSMSFSQSLEIRDFNTAGHSRDVLHLGTIIAEGIGVPVDRMLMDSLLLHDIGKLGIPDRILLKESPLTEEEWKIMKTHPELGASLLGHFESYREISAIILAHQEHFDGSGYPRGLKGDRIPLFARIIAIADAYHAMTSNRPYRKALPAREAVRELKRNSGKQFDAALVDAFMKGLLQRSVIAANDL
ncbi:MAG: HD domain-containing phosphohydrolase [Spirochaetia bacterium]|jgi:response regulator RpfG family c-di-GMP phosphodiesterase/signal transduction histidine kinase